MKDRRISLRAIREAGNCPTCRATGQVPQSTLDTFRLLTCPACEGTGRLR